MESMTGVAQKLQRDTRAERTKEVERELGLQVETASARSPELFKSVFQKLRKMFEDGGEEPVAQPAEGEVIPPTPVIGGGGG